jgi:hypothetical protein
VRAWILISGPYRIGEIDFAHLVDGFFWDVDFLHGDELVDRGGEKRERRLISPEAYSTAAGLAPHPAELEIRLWEEAPDWEDGEEGPASDVILCYPPEDNEEGA